MDCYTYSVKGNYTRIPFQCNTVNGSANLLTGEVQYSAYGYKPDQSPTQGFLVLFSVGLAAQIALSVFYRCWWTLPTLAAGTALEVLGWAGRLWSIYSWKWEINQGGLWYSNFNAYIMQICCLVIAPTFFSAANYILLGKLIANAGPEYTSLHSQSFSTLFIIADIVCLVVQAAGGGIAGTANTSSGSDTGAYIMTAGVVLQLVVTVIYIALFVEWMWRRSHCKPARKQYNPFARFSKKKGRKQPIKNDGKSSSLAMGEMSPTSAAHINTTLEAQNDNHYGASSLDALSEKKIKLMCGLISAGTFLIVIRSFYRSVELSNGWTGRIATNEPLFCGLDAALMFIFVYLYAVVHPGLVFGKRSIW
ncbi:uncharacterized protein L201_003140 [Kwoniella dendrophila CBS 6074]|uniref:Parasitic phase-specific protein PSP-1 n=1 Tax=Kwoniella dendrophila CBS 6074 TaxID=1295534 RepID=A0AAX4JTI9_9TREE